MINKFIFYTFLFVSFLFCEKLIVGRVHSVSGEADIYSSNYVNPHRKAIVGRAIYEGDQISTSNNGICQILYDDKNILFV